MKRKILIPIIFCMFLVYQHQLWAQFTPEEIAQRPEIEQLLKSAKIINAVDIGEGVTKPKRVFLECEQGEFSGCWKDVKGQQKGYVEGWRYEIAAYEMDKLLDLNMIPPTVEREFEGKKGSFQLWIKGGMSDLARMDESIEIPEGKLLDWNKNKYIMRAFDCLIANEDRTQQNIRYTDDWRMILIDHSRSFRSSKKFTDNLVYGKNGILGAKLFRVLPRSLVEKIKALDFDTIKAAMEQYLTEKEIKSVLKRKELLVAEIDMMIKEKGEDKTLY
jgi:hypothetical protein